MNGIAACIVTGVIYAMTGNPVPHAKVTAWMEPKSQTVQGKLIWQGWPSQPVITDSHGTFKLSVPQGAFVCMCIGDTAVALNSSLNMACKYTNAVCLEVPMKSAATLDELILAHDSKVNERNYEGNVRQ